MEVAGLKGDIASGHISPDMLGTCFQLWLEVINSGILRYMWSESNEISSFIY